MAIALELLYDFREPDYRKKFKDSKDRIGISKTRASEIGDLEEMSLDKGTGRISAQSSICLTEDGRCDEYANGISHRFVNKEKEAAAEEHYNDLLKNIEIIQVQL